MPKPTPADKTERTEAEIQSDIARSLEKPVKWRPHVLSNFDIGVELPREPVRQAETFYDEGVGNSRLEMYISVGDEASYVVGRLGLPYSVEDETLLREIYTEAASGFAEDSSEKFEVVADFRFEGKLGVEMATVPKDAAYLPTRLRCFVFDRAIYILVSMPLNEVGKDSPPSKPSFANGQADEKRFFSSVLLKRKPVAIQTPSSSPLFESTFVNGIFKSKYFGFSILLPEKWLKVSDEDMGGVRKVGMDIVSANSDRGLALPKSRQNLASFVSKPLGSDGNAMIALNLGVKGNSIEEARKLAETVETIVSKITIYEVTKKPALAKLGAVSVYTLETKIKLGELYQYQAIFIFPRNNHILSITLTYFDERDRKKAIDALEKINFDALPSP
ncbi:MAG: hypothetical protein IPG67_18075 [Acidobacteria bacterium]|nr:hypothetical protein [Acidobacteriota bacterium]